MLYRCSFLPAKAFSALLLSALFFSIQGQSPVDNSTILQRLDRLEKQNQQLLEEIKLLREQIRETEAKPTNGPTASPENTAAEALQVNSQRTEELAQTKVEASQKFPVQLSGMALFNAFLNGRYSGGAQYPAVAALNASSNNNGASFRQSIIGLTFNGPTTFLGGKVSGSLYLDLFGGSGQSLNQLVRLRVAKVQMDWSKTTAFFGLDKPLISQRDPDSIAQVGISPLTGAGNPWLWLPQIRLEQRFPITPKFLWKAEAALLQTNEAANVPATVAGFIESARPALEGRISARYKWNEERMAEFASGFHVSTTHFNGFSAPSRLVTVDWLIKPERWLEWKGLLFRGRNFASLGALGGVALTPANRPLAIGGIGGWSEVRFLATSRLTFNLYGGQQDDQDRYLPVGRVGKNQTYAANMTYLFAPNVLGSVETGQTRTTYLGNGNRLNNHYDLALAYLF